MSPFFSMIIEFWYTIAIVFILGRFLYYTNNGRKEFLFTYVLLAAVIFLICVLVKSVELSLGFAIGIFAIFGILRYRTVPISPREMTYIFLCAGIAAKNALVPNDIEFYKILVTDGSLLLLTGGLEYFLFRKEYDSKSLTYNNLELIHPDRREELIRDLDQRYGIKKIDKVKVGKIDSVKNSVRLQIHFRDTGDNNFKDE